MTKEQFMKKFDDLIEAFTDEKVEKKEFPQNGEQVFCTEGNGIVSEWRYDSEGNARGFFYQGMCFRTKEDAELMCDWLKAQRLTWMPESDWVHVFKIDINGEEVIAKLLRCEL